MADGDVYSCLPLFLGLRNVSCLFKFYSNNYLMVENVKINSICICNLKIEQL